MTSVERTAGELLATQAQGESAESITKSYLQAIRDRDGPDVGAFGHRCVVSAHGG